MLHQEAEDVAALATAETVEDLPIGVDVEARRLLVVEGRVLPVRPGLLQIDVAGDEGDDVRLSRISWMVDSGIKSALSLPARATLVHAAPHLLSARLRAAASFFFLRMLGLRSTAPPQFRQDARLLAGFLKRFMAPSKDSVSLILITGMFFSPPSREPTNTLAESLSLGLV